MEASKNIRKELVDTIINSMKNRDGVWQKTWANLSGTEAPYNPMTGTKYRGVNFLLLSLRQTELNTLDPRWCTFNQAVSAGYQINKNSKAAQATFYDLNVNLNDGNKDFPIRARSIDSYINKIVEHYRNQYPAKSSKIEEAANKAPQLATLSDKIKLAALVTELNKATGANITISSIVLLKTFPIFNYSQLQNVPELKIKAVNTFKPIQRAEGILVASGAKIFHDNVNGNYYSPKKHEIHLTPKESFKSPEAYYSTALHEIGHWTNGDGLARNLKVDGEINSERLAYAREELRAELASIFMSSDLNLKLDIQNHAAYLGSYLKVLNNDYNEFFAAVSDATKIATHVIGFEKRLDLESTEAQELQANNPDLYQKIVQYNSHVELLTTKKLNTTPIYDFTVGDIYTASFNSDLRKFEITEIDNNKLTVIDHVFDIVQTHTPESLQQMLNNYSCEKVQHEAKKSLHEVLTVVDDLTAPQKTDLNRAYLQTFFEEKNLPFKEFIVTHNNKTHFIPNDAVIDYLINSLDLVTQEKVKGVLIKLDFVNADINHFLEHCANGMVLQRTADLEMGEADIIKATLDSANEKTTDASIDTSNNLSTDNAIDDDNDFTI